LHALGHGRDGSSRDLCVDAVVQAIDQVALDGLLIGHHAHVLVDLLVLGDDESLTLAVELRTPGSAEDLLHIEDSNVLVAALLGVIDFGALDENTVGGQVDSPSECGSRAEDLDVPF